MNIQFTSYCFKDEIVKRTWKERLFTWPWTPWKSERKISVPAMYRVGDTIIAHVSFKSQLNDLFDKL